MTKREDGKETRFRLLNAACEVFAQKGYRDTKVAAICKRAGANVASVNYYFGDKASLYREAWQHALQNYEEPVFSETADTSSRGRLQAYIRVLLENFTVKGKAGQFSRLYLMEMVHPTGLIQAAWRKIIEPRRQRLHAIIRDIIGQDTEDLRILFCELSIINQCRTLVTISPSDLEYMLGQPIGPELIKRLAAHIADFSLAGIQAVGQHTD